MKIKPIKKLLTHSYKTKIISFGWLYKVRSIWVKSLIAGTIGLVLSLLMTIFIKNTSLYTGGTSAFCFGIARLVQTALSIQHVEENTTSLVYNALFWGLYLMFNIPLFFFAYKKIGKTFAIVSMVYLASNQICGFLWGLVPNMKLDLFGSTANLNIYMSENYKIDTVVFVTNIIPTPSTSGILVPDWTNPSEWITTSMIGGLDKAMQPTANMVADIFSNTNYSRAIALLLYAVIFSIIASYGIAMLFVMGASSGGSDFITIWYANKKHSSVGKVYTIINSAFMVMGVLLGSYVTGIMAWNDIKSTTATLKINNNPFMGVNYVLSANLICSLMYIVVHGVLIEKLFPSKKLVECEITSKKNKEIDEKIFTINNSYTAYPIKRYYKESSTIRFICSYFDFADILREIKSIDQETLMISSFVADIDGPIDLFKSNFRNEKKISINQTIIQEVAPVVVEQEVEPVVEEVK